MKRLLIFPSVALLLLLATLLSVGSKSARAKSAGSATGAVKIDNFSFAPTIVTVPLAKTSTGKNLEAFRKPAWGIDRSSSPRVFDPDEKSSTTFKKPAGYPYF